MDTTIKSESQKVDDLKSEKGSSEKSGQNEKASLSDERISPSRSPAQTAETGPDITPPGRVRAVTMKVVSVNQIDLRWAGVKDYDLNHYNVYMNTKPSFEVSPGVTLPSGISYTNSYSSIGLNPYTTYYYKIAAVDDANNIGPMSNTKPGMTKGAGKSTQRDGPAQELTGLASSSTIASSDTTPPSQVTGLIVRTLSSTQLYLTWTRVTASDFNHYNIYKGISGFTVTPGVTVPTGTSTASSYSNTGLNPSTTYSYRVAAVDNAGNIGPLSSQVSKTTAASTSSRDKTPPAQVTGLIVSTASSTQLNLAWNQVSASDFNHYNIYRGTSSNFPVSLGITPATGTSTANSYSSTILNPSSTYYYKVAAVDNAGNIGPLSSEKSAGLQVLIVQAMSTTIFKVEHTN